MTAYRPQEVLHALERHGVRYVLIGGLAAVLHGSALPTYDVDITPEASTDNLARLSEALRALDARVRVDGVDGGLRFSHDAASLAAITTLNLVTRAGDLDITLHPAGIPEFGDWERDAVRIDILGVAVTVASLDAVVRSKEATGRPKDRAALPMLRELQARLRAEGRSREGRER
ncbi:MAG: hypothetical protein L0H84_01695 [Pseudonocardia sp.]|nr:hypothetical protein [Pseudonocardia sp.]